MNQSSEVPEMVLIGNGAPMAQGVDQRAATDVEGRKAE
jgi:hypothetical protein